MITEPPQKADSDPSIAVYLALGHKLMFYIQWYGVAQFLYGEWRKFDEIKEKICSCFVHALSTPGYPETECVSTYNKRLLNLPVKLSVLWGNQSGTLSRSGCEDASFPQLRAKFDLGLNQVIADYYEIDLIELRDPADYLPPLGGADSRVDYEVGQEPRAH